MVDKLISDLFHKITKLFEKHLVPAVTAVVLVVLLPIALAFDRRPPYRYYHTEIQPTDAHPGDEIVIVRQGTWRRLCEGTAYSEIIGSDRIIHLYDHGLRYPTELDYVSVNRTLKLPLSLSAGPAIYRGVIRFANCGITSQWWPLEVEFQSVVFNVIRE